MSGFDAILIAGGGVREAGELPPWCAARFDRAIELQNGEPLVCLSAGTTHRPPPLDDGFPLTEAAAGARYLLDRHIPASQIRLEPASVDTIGNAWFGKLLHVDPAGWRRLVIITSEFHMPRTRAVFEWIFGFTSGRYELRFESAPNRGLSPEQLASRLEKERIGLLHLETIKERIRNLHEFHQWFWTEHEAYSPGGSAHRKRSSDPRVLASY